MKRYAAFMFAAYVSASIPAGVRAGQPVTLCAAGDILLDRGCGTMIRRHGNDYPFARVGDFIRFHDIAFANLECPVSSRGTPRGNPITFRADSSTVGALAHSGFTVLSLANNHILDYGPVALLDTRRILESGGFHPVGAGIDSGGISPVILERRGVRIAFLAYVDVPGFIVPARGNVPRPAQADTAVIRRDIEHARTFADHVIVSFHWGDEYHDRPNADQVRLGRFTVDSGADLVIGHHPHVIQSIEKYRGRFILYSLGNFVFDQHKPVQREAIVFSCLFRDGNVIAPCIVPVILPLRTFRPVFPECAESTRVLERVKNISTGYGVVFRDGDSTLFLE